MLHDAYCAGFFDGEGSVYLAQRYCRGEPHYTALVCIGNCDLEVLEEHKKQFGGSICKRSHTHPRHRTQYQWVLSSRQALPYLKAMQPHLIIKAAVVALAIEFINLVNRPAKERLDYSLLKFDGRRYWTTPKSRPEHREKVIYLRDRIREINARGYNAKRKFS